MWMPLAVGVYYDATEEIICNVNINSALSTKSSGNIQHQQTVSVKCCQQ